MNLRDARLWTTVVSVAVVLLLVALDSERTSPGPLSAVHAQIPELAAAEGCDACHGGWFQSMEGACTGCHELIATQIARGQGLHGTLETSAPSEASGASACAACHSEHHGLEFALAGDASFAQAGLGEREQFDHGHVEFGLLGRHADLTCKECHAQAEAEVLPVGTQRFLGLIQDCASCHADPHEGRFARSCQSCHGQELAFAEVASFVHTAAFPLTGGHAIENCETCHEPGGSYSIEALAGFSPAPLARDCAGCHTESPHDAGFLTRAATLAEVTPAAGCGECHDPSHGSFAGEQVALAAELHAATGFALTPPHADLECAECHGAQGAFAARHPGRTYAACESCHADPHAGQFAGGAFEGQGCLSCHRETSFRPPAFDLETHGLTAFPLEGTHRAVACSACHGLPGEGEPRRFRGTATACEDCHADPHTGTAAGTIASEACDRCHGTTAFSEVLPEAFDHGLHGGFALENAHAAAACEACHQPGATAGATGRVFGRAAATDCAGCHASVHDPFFAGQDCARCHGTAHFADLAASFEHGPWTGFELEGAHARASCESCHGVYPRPDLAGRRLGRVSQLIAGPRERCESCHADPHGGAFDGASPAGSSNAGLGCARCHDTTSFDQPREDFDHGLWTGHELAGAHAEASCAACHAPFANPAAAGRSFARAAGRACADCHADPHVGQFRPPARELGGQSGPADCADCHGEGSFEELSFDHRRDSRFALDESHARLECAACHRPWPLPEGGEVVRYKPLGTQCVDCHDHGGRKQG